MEVGELLLEVVARKPVELEDVEHLVRGRGRARVRARAKLRVRVSR